VEGDDDCGEEDGGIRQGFVVVAAEIGGWWPGAPRCARGRGSSGPVQGAVVHGPAGSTRHRFLRVGSRCR
jgi:hypothetical protein